MAPMALNGYRRHSLEARTFDLLEHLRETGGSSRAETCEALGWTDHQFRAAVDHARTIIGPALGVTIPQPVPDDGFLYRATGEWISIDGTPAIEAGTSYALGQIESRLRSVFRDVEIAAAHMDTRSLNGRKLNYLKKHLNAMFDTLGDIGNSVTPQQDRGVA